MSSARSMSWPSIARATPEGWERLASCANTEPGPCSTGTSRLLWDWPANARRTPAVRGGTALGGRGGSDAVQAPAASAPPALLELLAPPSEPPPIANLPWDEWKEVTKVFPQHRRTNLAIDPDFLAASIAADLGRVLQDARAGPDPRIRPAGRALILLDTVEEWGTRLTFSLRES